MSRRSNRRKRRESGTRLFDSNVCAFCGTKDEDELLYGKFLTTENISMHSNCMFFASGLSQRGRRSNVGFCGFLLSDIETELLRGKKLLCSYCRKKGATVGCSVKECKKCFHLPCGIERNSLHQHFGTFASFCKDHRPKQVPLDVTEDPCCNICYNEISHDLRYCLYSPCCKNSWFHKMCLQKYALSAGRYFFKCPLCNNSKQFVKEMETYGICIPEKDASWELEDNAYQELLVRPECDVDVCQCPNGRSYDSGMDSGWTLLTCCDCGSHARHKICESLNLAVTSWKCEECISFERKIFEAKEADTALDTEIKENLYVEVPAFEENNVNVSDPTSSGSSQFSSFCFSPSCLTLFSKDQDDDNFHLNIPHIIAPNKIDTEASEIRANFNTCITVNSSNVSLNAEVSERQKEIEEKDFKFLPLDSNMKITSQEKQDNNLKDIKNLSPAVFDPLKKSGMDFKTNTIIKKTIKKRKIDSPCSNSKHFCIRKYFGQECGKYRL